MNNNKYYYLLIGLFPLIFYIAIGFLFQGRHNYMILPNLVASAFIGIYFSHRIDKLKIVCYYNIPIIGLLVILSLFIENFTRSITYILFIPIIFITAIYIRKVPKFVSYISWLAIILLPFFAQFVFFPNLFTKLTNKDPRIIKDFPKIAFINANNDTVSIDNNKIYILDFWSTSCGICFKKFPKFNEYHNMYSLDTNIVFYSVNVPLARDKFDSVVERMDNLKYSFKTIYSPNLGEVEQILDIRAFPHILIIKNNKIYYSGDFITEKNIFINNFKNELDRVINTDT